MSRSNQIRSSSSRPALVGSSAYAELLIASATPQPRHEAAAAALLNLTEVNEASARAILEGAFAEGPVATDSPASFQERRRDQIFLQAVADSLQRRERVFRPPLHVVREPLAVKPTEADLESSAEVTAAAMADPSATLMVRLRAAEAEEAVCQAYRQSEAEPELEPGA